MTPRIPVVTQPLIDTGGTMARPWYVVFAQVFQLLTFLNVGKGDPTGMLKAPQGSLFLRIDGGAGSTLYVKEGPTVAEWAAK